MKSHTQRDPLTVSGIATGFLQTMYFDLELKFIGGSVEQIIIVPDAPVNWESESCKLTPYVRYEYIRVSKNNPETSGTGRARINRALKHVKLFIKTAKSYKSVLRVVKNPIVIKLQPGGEDAFLITDYYLEDSLDNLNSDPIASKRKTRDIPPHLKEKGKAASKKSNTKPKTRPGK
jgi:hypothetical protein